VTHEWIDQRSLAMDKKIAQAIKRNPELLQQARATLSRWIQQRKPNEPAIFQEWQRILTTSSVVEILDLLTSDDQKWTPNFGQ
jgi:hypothetical protein